MIPKDFRGRADCRHEAGGRRWQAGYEAENPA